MPARVPRLSVRNKVLASAVVVVLLIALFIFGYYPNRQREAALAAMRERARSMAGMLALGVGIGEELNEFAVVTATLEWAKQDSALAYVVVLDTSGQVFATYNHMQTPIELPAVRDQPVMREDRDRLQVATPVTFRGGRLGTLLLGLSLAPMEAQIARDRVTPAVITLLVLGVGVGLSVFFANRIARPIDQLR
ncbi:MAG TPA: hypothetical protein VH137_02730, partial [Gemmatimonadales bacterium]|nr:hypothetical protein [Gemmatimonadales bacterium]